MLSVLKKDVAK